jgi:hypothetical protein
MFPELSAVKVDYWINIRLTVMETWTNLKVHRSQFPDLFHGEVRSWRKTSEKNEVESRGEQTFDISHTQIIHTSKLSYR